MTNFNISKIREDFPILGQQVNKKPLVYFDNGATTQKPVQVIEAEREFYLKQNSNIHRGVHYLSQMATNSYENARETIRQFIGARSNTEIIFTKGTTDSINLVAFSFGERFVNQGDEVIVTEMEHHANIVPWQLLCERKHATLKVLPINDFGELCVEKLDDLISEKTRIVAVAHVSNVLGTVNPIAEIIAKAHARGVPVLIDGAQGIQHIKLNMRELDCDFYAFSGHKAYAPTGIGVLYAKEKYLEKMPPYQAGGDMVDVVSFAKTTYADLPFKFEAGTSNYVGAVAFAEAVKYMEVLGIQQIKEYENELLTYATNRLSRIEGLTIYGKARKKAATISFLLEGIHHFDTGMIIDKMGIATRTGTHCAQPLMQRLGIEGTVRASFAFYNTLDEIDRLYEAILKVKQLFG